MRNMFRSVRTPLLAALMCAGALMAVPATGAAAAEQAQGSFAVTRTADVAAKDVPSLRATTCQVFLQNSSVGFVDCTADGPSVITFVCTSGEFFVQLPATGTYRIAFNCTPGIFLGLRIA